MKVAKICLPRIQQLAVNLKHAVLNHQDKKIRTILETLQSEMTEIKHSPQSTSNLIATVKKLSQHRDCTISQLCKSLISKWNSNQTLINSPKKHKKTKKQLTDYYHKSSNNSYSNSNNSNQIETESKQDVKNLNTCVQKRGIVYIASMQRGKKWPEIKDKNGKLIKRINATSGSMNKIKGESAKYISPMYLGPVNKQLFDKLNINNPNNDDEYAILFENYWQYGKIFQELGHLDKNNKFTNKWLAFRKKGYTEKKGHRHPKGTKTNQILYKYTKGSKEYNKYKYHIACSSYYFGEYMNYLTSRKKVYCPIYQQLVQQTNFYKKLKQEVCQNGMDVMILDFDGPRGVGGDNDNEKCLKVTQQMLQEKINDTSAPFGHGYVFAAMLAGIDVSQYCQLLNTTK